jgi:hypothetical protein
VELSDEEIALMQLAFLFKIPLYKLLNEMPYEEYLAWNAFFKLYPPGQAEDYRAAAIVAATAPKTPIEKLFPSLVPVAKPRDTIGEKLEGSSIFQHMLNAKGGDKLDFK